VIRQLLAALGRGHGEAMPAWQGYPVRRDAADVAEAAVGRNRRIVVSYEYRRDAKSHRPGPDGVRFVSPLQSEFTWHARLVEGRKRELARCEIRSWTGWFDAVVPAPDGRIAAGRWQDQTEAGLVLLELEPELRQTAAAWDTRETNWLEGPVWTPDSRHLAVVENPSGAGPWWAEREPGDAEDDDPSPGGAFSPGAVVLLDRSLGEQRRHRVEVELPSGWFPAADDDRGLGPPRVEGGELAVRVPAGDELRLPLDTA
jgi:hypothetical protein